jgi:hypothetical protein
MISGLFQVNPSAKEAKSPPFDENGDGVPEYVVGSGLEECYFAGALQALSKVDSFAAEHVPGMLRKQADGMLNLAWATGSAGVWSHSARSLWAPGSPRFATQLEWPSSLRSTLSTGCATCPYQDSYHLGYAITTYQLAGAASAPTLLQRFTHTSTVPAALDVLKAWGKGPAPNWVTGSPLDQWFMLAPAFSVSN